MSRVWCQSCDVQLLTQGWTSGNETINELKSINKEFEETDNIEFDPSMIIATVHPNIIYISRLLKFTNLPQPINSRKVAIIENNSYN